MSLEELKVDLGELTLTEEQQKDINGFGLSTQELTITDLIHLLKNSNGVGARTRIIQAHYLSTIKKRVNNDTQFNLLCIIKFQWLCKKGNNPVGSVNYIINTIKSNKHFQTALKKSKTFYAGVKKLMDIGDITFISIMNMYNIKYEKVLNNIESLMESEIEELDYNKAEAILKEAQEKAKEIEKMNAKKAQEAYLRTCSKCNKRQDDKKYIITTKELNKLCIGCLYTHLEGEKVQLKEKLNQMGVQIYIEDVQEIFTKYGVHLEATREKVWEMDKLKIDIFQKYQMNIKEFIIKNWLYNEGWLKAPTKEISLDLEKMNITEESQPSIELPESNKSSESNEFNNINNNIINDNEIINIETPKKGKSNKPKAKGKRGRPKKKQN